MDLNVKCAARTLDLQFRRSTFSGGADTPGTLFSQAEVSALVEHVQVLEGSTLIATFVPAGASLASYSFAFPAASVPHTFVKGLQSRDLQLRLKLKSTAGSSAVTRFYMDCLPASQWATVNDAGLLNPTSARVFGTDPVERTLIVLETPSPLDTWRLASFGSYDATGTAANDADPDGDRLPNLMEYVMGRDPNAAGGIGSNVPLEVTFLNRETPVQLDLRLLAAYDSKVRLTIQSSTNMQSWSTLSTRTGTGAWSIAPGSTTDLNGGARKWFKFSATSIPQNSWKQFFRVKAEELP